VTRETSGKSTVNLHAVPSLPDTAWTDYAYYTDGKIQQKIHSSGAKTICEYDPDGNLSKEEQYTSSAEKNIIAYTYNQRSFLSKITDAKNGVTYYAHDRAGRKLAEVLPNHYLPCTGLEEMNRTQFAYDKMDRLLRKTYNYIKPDSTWADIIVEAYRYDNNGNMVKKQDALGYNGGYGTEYSSTRATA
jgi:YD repeat-containing protein